LALPCSLAPSCSSSTNPRSPLSSPLLSPHLANPHVSQHIDFAFTSPYGGARAGRVKRKRAAAAAKKEEGGDEEDEE